MRDEQFLEFVVPHSLASAREELRDRLSSWGCQLRDDIVLVFSELITNATVHTTQGWRAVVTHVPPHVRIEVHDGSHAGPHVLADPSQGGLGMAIVAKLSDHWGWESTATGKFVWCLVACGG